MPDTSDHSEELRDALQRQSDRLRKHQTQSFNVVLTDDEIAWAEHRAEEADLTVREWIQHVVSVEIQFAHANSNETRPVRGAKPEGSRD